MSGINTETVVMMGAALAGAGQVQANEGAHEDKATISWTEAQRQALMAELKEQCAGMSDGVQRVLDTYDLDKLKEVKATLRTDGQKFNYMLEGNKYSLSGGFDGKPFNMEIVGQDGSRIQTSQGNMRSSAALYDENGQLTGVMQKDERTGNVVGRFQSDGVVLDVAQKGISAIENGDLRTAIELAMDYYDKTYQYALQKRKGHVLFRYEGLGVPEQMAEEIKEETYKRL